MQQLSHDPTFIGNVESVSGSKLLVRLSASVTSGFSIIDGKTYRVGQVGSFIRIPLGYQELYGVISETGANQSSDGQEVSDEGLGRWMQIHLVGETVGGGFERGISQYPNIDDNVHLATEEALFKIYGERGGGKVVIGSLSSAESIPATLSLNELITRHSTVLGSTGSGKSTTIASLLRSIISPPELKGGYPNARVLLLDVHGEYSGALSDVADVLSIDPTDAEENLEIPFWALNTNELFQFLTGSVAGIQATTFIDKVFELKRQSQLNNSFDGIDADAMTVDTPIPYSLKQLWYDLIDVEAKTFHDAPNTQPTEIIVEGDVERLIAPIYQPYAGGGPFKNKKARNIDRQLDMLRSRLLDRRFDFLLHPGDWEPDTNGNVTNDLDALLENWVGGEKPITAIDLSAVPSDVLEYMISAILKIVYDALFWGRAKEAGGIQRPLLIVMEEAHRYLSSSNTGAALGIAQRIAKEGRKYGIGCMVISQRPSEVDETILSQCGTFFALRLSNPSDRARVKGVLPDGLASLLDVLPVLRTGEAIVMGDAAKLPMRCRITLPEKEHQPRSADPKVSEKWAEVHKDENYSEVVAAWRNQRPSFKIPEPNGDEE